MSMVRVRKQRRKGSNPVSSPEHHRGETTYFRASSRSHWRVHQRVRLTGFIAYEEEADGFSFKRTRPKKAKADVILLSGTEEPTQEETTEPAPTTRKPKKKATGSPSAAPVENGGERAKRRSARHSREHENADPPAVIVKKRRKDRASSELKHDHGVERSNMDSERAKHEPQQDHTQPIEVTFDATTIALPFADTPIIRRNKEMRKTNAARRSSLGMRGRRASSLIDTGRSNGNESTRAVTVLTLTANQPCLMTKSRVRSFTST